MFLTTRRMRPSHDLSRLQNEMNRMLNGVFGADAALWPAVSTRSGTAWPKLDVSETEDSVHISAELPGLKEDEIEVEVMSDTLRISGEKKDERVVDKHNFHSVERSFGRFDRTVMLPVEVDSKKAEATFEDGVLKICLPKTTPVSAQKITVKPATNGHDHGQSSGT